MCSWYCSKALDEHQCGGVHQCGFLMFRQCIVQELLNIEYFFIEKKKQKKKQEI
jgi:hypothetical protein